jgi:hypothetical protein
VSSELKEVTSVGREGWGVLKSVINERLADRQQEAPPFWRAS